MMYLTLNIIGTDMKAVFPEHGTAEVLQVGERPARSLKIMRSWLRLSLHQSILLIADCGAANCRSTSRAPSRLFRAGIWPAGL